MRTVEHKLRRAVIATVLLLISMACLISLLVLRSHITSEPSSQDMRAGHPANDVPDQPLPAWRRQPSGKEGQSPRDAALPPDKGLATAKEPAKTTLKKPDKDAIPNEYTFSFYDDADQEKFIRLAESRGINIIDRMDFAHGVRIRVADHKELEDLLRDAPVPLDYSPNYYVKLPDQSRVVPIESEGMYAGFGNSALRWLGVGGERMNMGKGMTIAVLDTGVQAHPALPADRVSHVSLSGAAETLTKDGAASGHGTAIASLLVGESDAVEGIAPGGLILDIQVLSGDGVGDSFTLAKGIIEAVNRGANVINLSLGTSSDSPLLSQAVAYAISHGVAVVAAVGNDASDEIAYPARYDGVLAVSSVDAKEGHLSFANYGEAVDISAPGIGIAAAWTDNSVALLSGTSFSAPFVSGAVADLMAANPKMTATEAMNILFAYADDAGAPGKDDEYGNGILDMRRVEERNTAGIYDVAVGDICLQGGGENPVVVLYVQNRGTEPLTTVEMKVEVNGVPSAVSFYGIAVGKIASRELQLSKEQFDSNGTITISCTATAAGVEDAYPDNDSRRAIIRRK